MNKHDSRANLYALRTFLVIAHEGKENFKDNGVLGALFGQKKYLFTAVQDYKNTLEFSLRGVSGLNLLSMHDLAVFAPYVDSGKILITPNEIKGSIDERVYDNTLRILQNSVFKDIMLIEERK